LGKRRPLLPGDKLRATPLRSDATEMIGKTFGRLKVTAELEPVFYRGRARRDAGSIIE
jgi:hypothetical protein